MMGTRVSNRQGQPAKQGQRMSKAGMRCPIIENTTRLGSFPSRTRSRKATHSSGSESSARTWGVLGTCSSSGRDGEWRISSKTPRASMAPRHNLLQLRVQEGVQPGRGTVGTPGEAWTAQRR